MYDIIFISNNELNADQNWQYISNKFLNAKKVSNIKGIHQAHKQAARMSFTKMFWVVDGDARVQDDFNFDYIVPEYDLECVHIFKSLNPINDLVYGYGAIKLLPRKLVLDLDTTSLDMTLSISNKIKIIDQISNITEFNTDPFSTWRSAFRECVKLTLNVIHKKDNDESLNRLNTWCEVGIERSFGEYCVRGARAGKNYVLVNANDESKIKLINDFDWLKERFEYDRF